MPSDYEKIREENIREYGEGTRHLSFLGRLYTDRTHFIFELLQNAEDAGASNVLFQLAEDKLEFFHDGRLFDEKDVRGVCGIGEGTKTEDLTQIGKFGIGFKSVYAYTTTPEIYSGEEHFKIEHYVRPYSIPKRDIGNSWTTLFVFPFNREEVKPANASEEIGTRLCQLSARTLLFLRKIQEIKYILPDGTGGVYLRDEAKRGRAREVTVIGQSNGKEESESWWIFERPVNVPNPDQRQVQVEIGFRLQKNEKEQWEEVVKIKDSPLVVFFPTEKETRLGFLIQGPYKTTPARDNIPKDDNWNAILVRETACLVADVLPQLKDLGLLTVSLLEALPIRPDDFPENGMFYPIFTAVREAFKTKELLPTDDGSFVSAQNAKLARGAELKKLLSQEELCQLFESSAPIKWLAGNITQDRTPELRSYLIGLGVEEVTPEVFARKINLTFLSKRPDGWVVNFYTYLLDQEALWRSARWGQETGGVLRSKPIIRLENGKQVVPFKSDGTTPNAFLPPPDDTDFPVVKRSIAGDERALNFLKRLGLAEPDLFDEIIEKVLPKYLKNDLTLISEAEHHSDIQKILRALNSDSEAGKKRVIHEVKQTPFLKAVNFNGNETFKKPGDIYLDSEDLRFYFSGSTDVWFLSEDALVSGIESSILSELGIVRIPRFRRITVYLTEQDKSRLRKSYGYTYEIETIDYDIHGLEGFLSRMPQDYQQIIQHALSIWRFLLAHLKENFDYQFYEGEYKWFYYREQSTHFPPTWKKRLQESSWLPKNGSDNPFKPCEVSLNDLPEQFERNERLAELLDMKKDYIAILAKQIGLSPEIIKWAQELEKNPDLLEKLKKFTEQNMTEFPTKSVTNRAAREEKVRKQISESKTKEFKTQQQFDRPTRRSIDPTSLLRGQYTNFYGIMVCQICKKEMPFKKPDGEYYFEAVEAFTDDIFPKEHEAQFLALCPVCAARYKVFIKNDKEAMNKLRKKILNMDTQGMNTVEIPLKLGDLETTLKFVATHFCDMQTILQEMEK